MLILDLRVCWVVLHMNWPLVFSCGQYLHEASLLQGLASLSLSGFSSSSLVLVDALTKWSERFLLRRRPKTIFDSRRGLDVLVLPRISQLDEIISLIGGLRGSWVMTQ